MSTADEIEAAIQQLSDDDLARLRTWFAEFDQEQWDRQLADDETAGGLDPLIEEALADLREGRCTDL